MKFNIAQSRRTQQGFNELSESKSWNDNTLPDGKGKIECVSKEVALAPNPANNLEQ